VLAGWVQDDRTVGSRELNEAEIGAVAAVEWQLGEVRRRLAASCGKA
jgi:hypothetical protein